MDSSSEIEFLRRTIENGAHWEDKLRRFIRRETDAKTKEIVKGQLQTLTKQLDAAETKLAAIVGRPMVNALNARKPEDAPSNRSSVRFFGIEAVRQAA